MFAIMKRELSSYFSSIIGYVVLAIFYFFGGFYFYANCLHGNSSSINYVFSALFIIVIFVVPIITMRLLSEEKRQKTDQLLLTAPINLTSIALGKYFAAVILFLLCIAVNILFVITIAAFTAPDWSVFFSNFLGLFLLGSAFISIGLFLSSITESQVIAAICGFAVGVFIAIMDSITSLFNIEFLNKIIKSISFTSHYDNFTMGIIDIKDVVFFVSISVLFVFLTVRVLEKKRWS